MRFGEPLPFETPTAKTPEDRRVTGRWRWWKTLDFNGESAMVPAG
jgi:hypothetical protein